MSLMDYPPSPEGVFSLLGEEEVEGLVVRGLDADVEEEVVVVEVTVWGDEFP